MPYHYAQGHELEDVIRVLESDGETITDVVPDTVSGRVVSFHIFTASGPRPMMVRPAPSPANYRAGGAA